MKIEIKFGDLTKEVAASAKYPAQMKQLVWTRLRVVSFNAERFIKIRMPVATGRARASWGHSTGADPGIWIENPDSLSITQGSRVEYIEYLNEGSSQQAPAGFIDAEIARAVADLEKGVQADIDKLIPP